jgi:hypothetical protein
MDRRQVEALAGGKMHGHGRELHRPTAANGRRSWRTARASTRHPTRKRAPSQIGQIAPHLRGPWPARRSVAIHREQVFTASLQPFQVIFIPMSIHIQVHIHVPIHVPWYLSPPSPALAHTCWPCACAMWLLAPCACAMYRMLQMVRVAIAQNGYASLKTGVPQLYRWIHHLSITRTRCRSLSLPPFISNACIRAPFKAGRFW